MRHALEGCQGSVLDVWSGGIGVRCLCESARGCIGKFPAEAQQLFLKVRHAGVRPLEHCPGSAVCARMTVWSQYLSHWWLRHQCLESFEAV